MDSKIQESLDYLLDRIDGKCGLVGEDASVLLDMLIEKLKDRRKLPSEWFRLNREQQNDPKITKPVI